MCDPGGNWEKSRLTMEELKVVTFRNESFLSDRDKTFSEVFHCGREGVHEIVRKVNSIFG